MSATVQNCEIQIVFPTADAGGRVERPDAMIVLRPGDVVKDVLTQYFSSEDLVIFWDEYTLNGVPLNDALVARDMGIESGSNVAIVRVMNTGPTEQLARVKARTDVAKQFLGHYKRRYDQVENEIATHTAVYESTSRCKREHIHMLRSKLRECEQDLTMYVNLSEEEQLSKICEREEVEEELKGRQETFDKLDAALNRLETVVSQASPQDTMPDCIICLEKVNQRGILNCGHAQACFLCYDTWYAKNLDNGPTCPTCREPTTSVGPCNI